MREIRFETMSREARSLRVVFFARLWYGRVGGFQNADGRSLARVAANARG